MSGSDLIRDERVGCLDHEATVSGFRRRFRTTSVTDCESWVEATYDPFARRITVMEHELTAFRTGHAPVENSWRRLSLTIYEARALNDRLCQLLAEARSAPEGEASAQVMVLSERVAALETRGDSGRGD